MNNLESCLTKLYKIVDEEMEKYRTDEIVEIEDKVPFFISQYQKEKYKVEKRLNFNKPLKEDVIEEKKVTEEVEETVKVELKWYRINKNIKLNRIYNFLDEKKEELKIPDEIFKKLISTIIFMFNDKQLKNSDFDFDSENNKLLNISNFDELLESFE